MRMDAKQKYEQSGKRPGQQVLLRIPDALVEKLDGKLKDGQTRQDFILSALKARLGREK
jgi:aconitase A